MSYTFHLVSTYLTLYVSTSCLLLHVPAKLNYPVPCTQMLFPDASSLIYLFVFLQSGMTYSHFLFTWLISTYSSRKDRRLLLEAFHNPHRIRCPPVSQEFLCLPLLLLGLHWIVITYLVPSVTMRYSTGLLSTECPAFLVHSRNYTHFKVFIESMNI